MQKSDKSKYKVIDFDVESCPPAWCPRDREEIGCCHACQYFVYKNDDDEAEQDSNAYCTYYAFALINKN